MLTFHFNQFLDVTILLWQMYQIPLKLIQNVLAITNLLRRIEISKNNLSCMNSITKYGLSNLVRHYKIVRVNIMFLYKK